MNYPSYLSKYHNGELEKTVLAARQMLSNCKICPRQCGVNRLKGETGFCRTGAKAKICSYMPHFGEEPPLSGESGSGTIFFSNCNLRCVYCQNYRFSQGQEGREAGPEELAGFMLKLQETGCHNINLVTPTHVMPQILESLQIAIGRGLKIPICYNTSGYELPGMIKLLDGIVDIYLADMRYADKETAEKYSSAADYPSYNRDSVKQMHLQAGIPVFDGRGIIKKGLIIRHLVLPQKLSGTREIMKFIAKELSKDTYISLMSQYAPYHRAMEFKELSRRITLEEYEQAQEIMHGFELYNGWTQESNGLERFAGENIKRNI
ncbi:MAG: radical SAM protein [Candidatus Omnitrophica bacterium]|nr:radical SAM protein [Candidatus Omnitrophota bacterium]MDD5512404.1 radical SAM protein [Candidatus Omnitrophota bacterium]